MNAPTAKIMPHWPRLMSRGMAAMYLGIGETKLIEDGPQPKRFGARVLYDIRDLDRWADALDGQPLDDSQKKGEGDDMLARVQERLARGSN